MDYFEFEGRVYINGFAVDERKRPRTIKNGYSSEDEREAAEEYREARRRYMAQQEAPKNKHAKKLNITHQLTQEQYDLLYKNKPEPRKRFEDGYLLNESGEKISVENGYTDEDELLGKQIAEELKTFTF